MCFLKYLTVKDFKESQKRSEDSNPVTPATTKLEVAETVVSDIVHKPVMESRQLKQSPEMKDLNPPMMGAQLPGHNSAHVAERILLEIIFDCTFKTKKIANATPVVQDQSKVGRFCRYSKSVR